MCTIFNTDRFINIPENANMLSYLEELYTCLQNKGYFEYYNPVTKAIDNRIIGKTNYLRMFDDPEDFSPGIIIRSPPDGAISPYNSMYAPNSSTCALCKNLNILGFHNTVDPNVKKVFRDINPSTKKLFLFYKDLIIYDNNTPYMPGHLMICSMNHVHNKIIGSQYQILNINTLTDILTIYKKCSRGITMGHNYALTGSQFHFHIQVLLDSEIGFIPYNNMLDFFSTYLHGISMTNNIIINKEDIKDSKDVVYNLEYVINNEDKLPVFIAKFSCEFHGYKGILVSIQNNNDENLFKKYCMTVHKILNEIENSGSHSFSLYFGRSENYLNLCILPQKTTNVTSFRNITAFADVISPRVNIKPNIIEYNIERTQLTININTYVKLDVFTIEELSSFVTNKIYNEGNILGNQEFNLLLKSDPQYRTKLYNNYILSLIKDKTRVADPKVVLFHGPVGIGKSTSREDVNKILSDLNLDPKNFIYYSIDNIFENIPFVEKKLKVITNKLKEFNEMKISQINNLLDYDIKLKDLQDDKYLDLLSIDQYKELYRSIFEKVYDFTDNEPLFVYYTNNIKVAVQNYKYKIHKSFLEFVRDNKLNIICEVNTLDFEGGIIKNLTNELGMTQNNTIYISKSFYKYGNITDIQYKFLYRNVLFRNINIGRIINNDEIDDLLTTFYNSYNRINTKKFKRTPHLLNIASQYINLYANYDLDRAFQEVINNFITNINIYALPYTVSQPSFFENNLADLVCLDRNDDNINFKKLKEPLTNVEYKMACFELPPLLGLDEKFDANSDIKNKLTDYNTEFLFNDNVSSIIMNIFIKSMEESIYKYIRNFKTIIQTSEIEDKTIKLIPSDIKIVLKGGLSIRALSNQYITDIQNILENNIKLDEEANKDFKDVYNIFKSTFDSTITSPFTGIFKKSDIDFLCLLKKDKIKSKKDYDIITRDLQKIGINVLAYIKNILIATNFFDRENILQNKLQNIFNENVVEPSTKTELTHIIYKNAKLRSPTAVKTKLFNPLKKSSYVDKIGLLTNKPDDLRSINMTPSQLLINRNDFTNYIPNMNNSYSPYFITLNNNIKIIKGMVEEFSLIRLKNSYSCGFGNNPDLSNLFSGELIDLSFLSYESEEHESIKNNPEYIQRIRQTKDLFNFEINCFNLDFQLHEIEKMLIDTSIFIWENPKYAKRIKRFFFIKLLENLSSVNNIQEYIPIHNEYINILDYLKGENVVLLNNENVASFYSTEEEYLGESSNRFLAYLIIIKKEIDRINHGDFDFVFYTELVKRDFNIIMDLTTQDKIDSFKQYLQDNLKKFEIDFREILIQISSISQTLFKLYSTYPEKLEQLKLIRQEEKVIKQWGGYEKLYLDMKNKYYNLKYKKIF